MKIHWTRENLGPEERLFADAVNALHSAHVYYDPASTKQKLGFAHVLLKDQTARDILHEITRPEKSENVVARAIIEHKLGGAFVNDEDGQLVVAVPDNRHLERATAILMQTRAVASVLILG